MATTTKRAPAASTKTLPATMRAAAIDEFGPPSALTLHTVPVPKPGPHEVLIAVHAAGVGIWDARIRDGSWAKDPHRFPKILGTDGAGYVVGEGTGVTRFARYDRVWGYVYDSARGGFYAEYVAVHMDSVAPAPKGLKMLEAGAGAVTGLTALQGIDDHLDVGRNETVLIFGGSGAVGTLAIQFAKRRGAVVIATASGDDATRLVRELGADHALDARSEEVVAQLERLAPAGLDHVLALAGGSALDRLISRVKVGGRVAYPNGVEPEPKRRDGVRAIAYDAETAPPQWEALDRAVTEARLRVPLGGIYPLEEAGQAHARVERDHVLGRIVLKICEPIVNGEP
jgi:NADPH:quinone reductase-like Zn-dependent oxidoreductase